MPWDPWLVVGEFRAFRFGALLVRLAQSTKGTPMQIEPFGVEQWMNAHETGCALNLAETCAHSLSIAELMALAGRNERDLSELLPMRMTYGDIEGSLRLRTAIATC